MSRKRKTAKQLQREAALLQELSVDFDWNSAAKRAGIPQRTLELMVSDAAFQAKGQKLIDKAMGERSGVEDAVKRFRDTQKILEDELSSGNLDVSNALIKTHEMEFKMHGLFEKDNKQKGSNVMINISFDRDSTINIDGEEMDG